MFEKVVALYRAAGCPPIQGGQFLFKGRASDTLLCLINECRSIDEQFGRFTYERLGGDNSANFEFLLPNSDLAGFYTSFEEFIRATPSLGHGLIPDCVYIAEHDWASTDGIKNEIYSKLKSCCRLIVNLSKIVMLADSQSSPSHINLIFAVPADNGKPPKTFTIATTVEPGILEAQLSHLALIDQLANPANDSKLHLEERKAIFNLAVSELVNDAPETAKNNLFQFLLMNWKELLDTYWKNFQTYIHGFSFDKAKKDLAQAELDYGSKLSAAFSDIGGKLLALPISFGALVILSKASTGIETTATAAGILMVSLIFSGILANQWLNIKRLDSSLDIALSQIEKRIGTYPKHLQNLLTTAKREINQQQCFVRWTIRVFLLLSWAPTIGMIAMKWEAWFKPLAGSFISVAFPC
ncbi:hypothetical protein [Stutzerimonas stutzeri]|uniref:Uncharacterized protein n=1 Tax=Stutzerimonas stutzeri TaxID=316 RepID=A0A6I6LSI5_STUST|nr:hypothetical protein [Stutzerimonas stutzeri]QGZ31475.1 hypothetical protein GQA94_15905 [Stutzerimonas stutzeri]